MLTSNIVYLLDLVLMASSSLVIGGVPASRFNSRRVVGAYKLP